MALVSLFGCKLNFHDDVYPLANAKSRTIALATISPGDGTEYAFTYATQPSIEITCPVSGFEAYYSIDGGEYQLYTGPFTLPIADPKVDQTFTVSAYITHPDYKPSEPVSKTYRFVATIVPSPTISVTAGAAPFHEYYRYNVPPTVSATCSLPGATLRYSVDGGTTYLPYTGPFAVPVPADKSDWNVNRDITVTMYASATGFIDSPPASTAALHFYGQYAIVTIAGTGEAGAMGDGGDARLAQLNQPQGVCVDSERNVYIADSSNNKIRMISGVDGSISTIAGTGNPATTGDGSPAISAELQNPFSITIDSVKHVLYFAQTSSPDDVIRAVDLSNGYILPFTGGGTTTAAENLRRDDARNMNPSSVFYASNTLYIADGTPHGVWGVSSDIANTASLLHLFANGVGTPAPFSGTTESQAFFDTPVGVFANANSLFVACNNPWTYRGIHRLNLSLPPRTADTIFSATIMAGLSPIQPWVDDVGNLYVTERINHRVTLFDGMSYTVIAGTAAGTAAALPSDEVDGALPGTPSLKDPMGMFLVKNDGLYVADRGNNRIRKIILY